MSTAIDWSRFSVRVNINAPIEKLYHAWTSQQGIEHWFLRMSEYRTADGRLRKRNEEVEPGDTYKWRWHGYPDSVTEEGTVLDLNGKDLFKFSFGKAGNCTVKVYKDHDQSIVELVQDHIPTDEKSMEYYHVGCKTGWTFHLANMKSIFEGGIDLRNKDENLKDVLNS
ncbi:MAG TPA: SRPBCC domain-containing protein [Chitinophagaceae bacterium]